MRQFVYVGDYPAMMDGDSVRRQYVDPDEVVGIRVTGPGSWAPSDMPPWVEVVTRDAVTVTVRGEPAEVARRLGIELSDPAKGRGAT